MNELFLLTRRKRNFLLTRYYRDKAINVATSSGFSYVSYTCEYYAKKLMEIQARERKYRARVLLCDEALRVLEAEDLSVLKMRYFRKYSAEKIAVIMQTSVRTVYRRLARAEERFCNSVQRIFLKRHLEKTAQRCA